jgi:Ca2+-binding EF-hand superfamily protein
VQNDGQPHDGWWLMGRQERGPIAAAMMMRMMFTLMDADGDGSISLQEFQAAHERIFRGMDQNKGGRLTMEEMQSFMGTGTGR